MYGNQPTASITEMRNRGASIDKEAASASTKRIGNAGKVNGCIGIIMLGNAAITRSHRHHIASTASKSKRYEARLVSIDRYDSDEAVGIDEV